MADTAYDSDQLHCGSNNCPQFLVFPIVDVADFVDVADSNSQEDYEMVPGYESPVA